jgi:hypothetical protein
MFYVEVNYKIQFVTFTTQLFVTKFQIMNQLLKVENANFFILITFVLVNCASELWTTHRLIGVEVTFVRCVEANVNYIIEFFFFNIFFM